MRADHLWVPARRATPRPAPGPDDDRTAANPSSYLLLPVGQQRAQTATRVKHFRSHRTFRNSENPGDFGVRIALDIEQDDCGPAALRQLAERAAQTRTQLTAHCRRIGPWTSTDQ